MRKLPIATLVLSMVCGAAFCQDAPSATTGIEAGSDVKVWFLTPYQAAHLKRLVDEFNNLFAAEVEKVKLALKNGSVGYEDMPIEDVIYVPDPAPGYFITRGDYETLLKRQEEQRQSSETKKDSKREAEKK